MRSLSVMAVVLGATASALLAALPENLAPAGVASGSSSGFGSVFADANDGNRDGHFYTGGSVWHTLWPDDNLFYEVDLGTTCFLDRIMIWPRTDEPNQETVRNFTLKVLDAAGRIVWTANYWPGSAVNWAWGTSAPRGVAGRTVRFERRDGTPAFLTFAEFEVWGGPVEPTPNFARDPAATVTSSAPGSNTAADAARDGELNGNWASTESPRPIYQSAAAAPGQFWQVDLGRVRLVDYVILYARQDAEPTGEVRLSLRDGEGAEVHAATLNLRRSHLVRQGSRFDVTHDVPGTVAARAVRIETVASEPLALAEVEVFGTPADLSAPVLVRFDPEPGALVAELTRVGVEFNEEVTGVSADDLLVNGQPATRVDALTPRLHDFSFPQPSNGAVALAFAADHGISDAAGNGFGGAAWSLTLDSTLPLPRPVISEIMADNKGGLQDEDGDTPDWIEIHNPGPTAIDLGGWHLSDTPRTPAKWRFPTQTPLPAGTRRVVFASGKDRAAAGGELHTNFRLDAEGESVMLVKPDGLTVASQILNYPPQRANVSYGLGRAFAATPLLAKDAAAQVLVPANPVPGWTMPEFDDRDWIEARLGAGFDQGGDAAADGLLGWWSFDDASIATLATDTSGQGRDGVIARAVYSMDGFGRSGAPGDRSLVLNGNSVVLFPDAATGAFDAIAARDAFTISIWIFGAAPPPQNHFLFYGSTGPDGTGQRALDAHLPWSDAVIYFDTAGCCDTGETRLLIGEPDASQWSGRWNHYAFVKDGDSKQIWQNGHLLHQGLNTANQPPLRTLYLGALDSSGNTGYRGRLDDFAIWEGALDSSQIAALASGTPQSEVRRLTPLIRTDLGAWMRGINASVLVRAPVVIDNPAGLDLLTLRMRYDDGFVAWLNGVEVARRNAPPLTAHDATATAPRDAGLEEVAEELDLSLFAPLLRAGTNLLALHGLNISAQDGDFLVLPELTIGRSEPGRFFTEPTPGAANGAGFTGFVGDVLFAPTRGFYDGPVTVTLRCPTPGATLFYTTDGSTPGPDRGMAGTSPLEITVTGTTTLRASAVLGSLIPAPVHTHTYLFVNQVAAQTRPPTAPVTWPDGSPADFEMDPRVPGPSPAPGYSLRESLLSLPTLSLTTDPSNLWGASGLYANPWGRGFEWERFSSAEWMDPAASDSFAVGAGLRIHGNISRQKSFTPKHSFSLRFRSDYGDPTLRFPLFPGSPVAEFDELVLHAGSTDTWPCTEWDPTGLGPNGELYQRWNRDWASYVRDQWVRDAHLDMGGEAFRGRFCHLYLNGLYWGLYNVTESPSASHMAAHLGGPEREWDTVADFSELHDGTRAAWDQLLQLANSGLLSDDTGLRRVQGLAPDGSRDPALPRLLEVDELIDYMILHIVIGADDWPNHNWWGARRSRAPDPEGFRFFAWDQEISNENVAYARTSWGPLYAEANADGTPTRVYAQLRGSPEFRMRFADRIQRHLFHDGALTRVANTDRWVSLTAGIDRAVVAESARWGDAQPNHTWPSQPYTRENAWLPHLRWMTTAYWPHLPTTALARFRAANLWPTVAAPTLTPHGGTLPPLAFAALANPNTAGGTICYTLNGEDPRQWGGAVHPAALSARDPIALSFSTVTQVRARVRQGTVWSPLLEVTFTPLPVADQDHDGLPDDWERLHGFDPTDPADASLDSDGDDQTNLEEFLADTDPRDPGSRLVLRAETTDAPTGSISLRFDLRPARVYALEHSATLDNPASWTTHATFGPETAARPVTLAVPAGPLHRYFRLRVGPAP